MQRLRRLYLHGTAGRIPYAHHNHYSHQQPREHKGEEKAGSIERKLCHVHQLGHADVHRDDGSGHGGQCQQQQSLGNQTYKNAPTRTAHRHAEGHLLTTVLRAEPEGTNHTQEDVEQQEAQDAELRLDFVHILQLVDIAQLAEWLYVKQVGIAHTVEAVGIGHERIHETVVSVRRHAQAQLQVGRVLELHHHFARKVGGDEGPAPLVGSLKVVPARGLGYAGNAQAVVTVRVPQGQLTTQQRRGVGHAQEFVFCNCITRQDHRARL